MGATLYLTETLQSPYKYIACAIVDAHARFGILLALTVGYFALSSKFDWRLAFWIGSIIAVIGTIARIKLRETPEFINHQHRLKCKTESSKQYSEIYKAIEYKKKYRYKNYVRIILYYIFYISKFLYYIYLFR